MTSSSGTNKVDWILAASPVETLAQIHAVTEKLGLNVTVAPDVKRIPLYSPVPMTATPMSETQRVEIIDLGSFSGSIYEARIGVAKTGVAWVRISPLPGGRCTLEVWPFDAEWEERCEELSAAVRERLDRVGIAWSDTSQPAGPIVSASTADLQHVRPSERSMWVAPIFVGRDFHVVSDHCFVLLPLAEEGTPRKFYDHVVRNIVEGFGLECQHADDIAEGSTIIMEDVWAQLNQARFIIADVTGRNPNVFYELGIADVLGKRVIIIADKEGGEVRLPFDISPRRAIF